MTTRTSKRPSLREFIKANKSEIDGFIRANVPNAPLNNEERRMWILNDEGLYNWARLSGVRV